MIVIKVELWPLGDETRKKDLGTAHISNDGTGSDGTGNYKVRLLKGALYSKKPGTLWKSGSVKGFDRKRDTPWRLVMLGIASALGLGDKGEGG